MYSHTRSPHLFWDKSHTDDLGREYVNLCKQYSRACILIKNQNFLVQIQDNYSTEWLFSQIIECALNQYFHSTMINIKLN